MTREEKRKTRRCRVCDKTKGAEHYAPHMRTCNRCQAKIEQRVGSMTSKLREWISLANFPVAGK